MVIGSIFMDLVWSGMLRLAGFGQSVSCREYAYLPGGKGANMAVAAARSGAETFLVGCVGDDSNGHNLLNSLKKNGVHTDYTFMNKDAQSGLALMLIEEGTGRYVSYNVMGGNACVGSDLVTRAIREIAPDMVLLNLEIPEETVYAAVHEAEKQNIRVFLDAGPAKAVDLKQLRGVYIVSPNEAETEALTGILPDSREHARAAAKFLFDRIGPRYVILKMGEKGAFLYDGTDEKLIPAFSVDAVDSTAAGDTFGGTFANRYCEGLSVEESIRWANAASAVCVSRKGGQPSIPSEKEVVSFLDNVTSK